MLKTLQLSLRVTNRNWSVYKKSFWSNIAPTFSDPMFFIFSIGLGLGAYVSNLKGMSYVSFLAPGLAVSTALFTAFFETSYNFYIRYTYEGIYKAMLTTPIGVKEIIFGELIWVTLKGAGMTFGVAAVLCLFGYVNPQWLILILLVGGLVGHACGCLGFIATSLVKNINQFQSIYALMISPMFFFSGIFFPISDLPTPLQDLAQLSPLYHGVKLAQSLLWNRISIDQMMVHVAMLIIFSLISCWFAYKRIFAMLYK